MQKPEPNLEELVQAVCWKLYLEPNSERLRKKWEEFSSSSGYEQKIRKILNSLSEVFKQIYHYRLQINNRDTYPPELANIERLCQEFLELIIEKPNRVSSSDVERWQEYLENWHKIVTNDLKNTARNAIRKALSSSSPELPNLQNSSSRQTEKDLDTNIDALDRQIEIDTRDSHSVKARPSSHQNAESSSRDINSEEQTPQTQPISLPESNLSSPSQPPNLISTSNKNHLNILPEPEQQISTNLQSPSVDVAQWKYLPVPENEPDPHTEYSYKSEKTPEGLKIIGARVRGKMHKHQGTNCDDWFEFATSGDWTIIAVSDGAGSSKFSRVGAKASCEEAVKYLANELKLHKINELDTEDKLSAALSRDKKSWAFVGKDINFVQNCLHEAMKAGLNAIKVKVEERRDSLRYYKALGERELNIKDLSATLLLAVHTTIKVGENKYSLILTCQVGDGMLAAVSQEGRLILLGQPDSGEFAGQTEFLTSKNKIDRENLLRKTFVFPGKLRALLVMTDGVADNYFPNYPGILELYGDLVLNQVINISKPSDIEINEYLRSTHLGSIDGVKNYKNSFQDRLERILPNNSTEPRKVNISSVARYAAELGKFVADVVVSPALLAAGVMEEGMCDKCKDMQPEEKLKIWLDAYYQKGSFDDRTLVVLYQEEV